MAYIGIGYLGDKQGFLKSIVEDNLSWLKGDRIPRFFGDNFIVMYDSNTAREFAGKCRVSAPPDSIVIYSLDRIVE